MKSIRRCWNVLRGSGVDLSSRDGHIEETDQRRGKWVSVVSQLVTLSGGLHHFGCHSSI